MKKERRAVKLTNDEKHKALDSVLHHLLDKKENYGFQINRLEEEIPTWEEERKGRKSGSRIAYLIDHTIESSKILHEIFKIKQNLTNRNIASLRKRINKYQAIDDCT